VNVGIVDKMQRKIWCGIKFMYRRNTRLQGMICVKSGLRTRLETC
jgi:hypothetical protein